MAGWKLDPLFYQAQAWASLRCVLSGVRSPSPSTLGDRLLGMARERATYEILNPANSGASTTAFRCHIVSLVQKPSKTFIFINAPLLSVDAFMSCSFLSSSVLSDSGTVSCMLPGVAQTSVDFFS